MSESQLNMLNEPVQQEVVSRCVECGKPLKNGRYYSGKGPYGPCCYKKLFGDIGTKRIGKRVLMRKMKKGESICPVGLIRNCNSCVFRDDCKYRD